MLVVGDREPKRAASRCARTRRAISGAIGAEALARIGAREPMPMTGVDPASRACVYTPPAMQGTHIHVAPLSARCPCRFSFSPPDPDRRLA